MKSLVVLLISFCFNHNLIGSEDSLLVGKDASSSLRYTLNGQPFEDYGEVRSADGTYSFLFTPDLASNVLFIDIQGTNLRIWQGKPQNPYFIGYQYAADYRKAEKDKFEKKLKHKQERKPLSQLNVNEDTNKAEDHLSKKIKVDNDTCDREMSDYEINMKFSLFGNEGSDVLVKDLTRDFIFTTLLFDRSMTFRAPEGSPAFLREITFYKLKDCKNPMVWGRIDFSKPGPNVTSTDNFHFFSVIGVSAKLTFKFPEPLTTTPLLKLACEEQLEDDEDEKRAAQILENLDDT